jgi:chromosome segregation ATPase
MRQRLSLLLTFFLVLAFAGCRGGGRDSERRFVDIAVKIKENTAELHQLSLALDGMNNRIANIENTLQQLTLTFPAVGERAQMSSSAASQVGADSETISRSIASLVEELAAVRQELTLTKTSVEKIGVQLTTPKDIGKAAYEKLISDPNGFVNSLDMMTQDVSGKIEDPASRQNFEAEIAQLRDRVLTPMNPEEVYQELHARHVEKLNHADNDMDRQAIQEAITRLENCSSQELQERITEYARDRILDDFFRISKTYGVQKEELAAIWLAPSKAKR